MFTQLRSPHQFEPGFVQRWYNESTPPHDPQPSLSIRASPDLLPPPPAYPRTGRPLVRRWRTFLRANVRFRNGLLLSIFIIASLFLYTRSSSPRDPPWHRPSHDRLPSRPKYPHYVNVSETLLVAPTPIYPPIAPDTPAPSNSASSPPPSRTPAPDVLTLEEIRDIVAQTQGFFSRDYSLGLGWNNMRYIIDAAALQAELLNRTLVIPSFVYARACEYYVTVCADFATMVNKGDAIGWDEWRSLPYEQQMGFRIPISLMLDLPLLRSTHRVITASEYLRLHGHDPESESSSGYWPRDWYISRPNVFESNETKTPTQFVIENHWYDPPGVNRVDFLPQAMKRRGGWEPYLDPETQETAGYWPPEEPTDVSDLLTSIMPEGRAILDWETVKSALRAATLGPGVDLDNDDVVEGILSANGWEVLHTFESVLGMEYAKTVVHPIKEVAPRSTIRGFKDDYYHIDADVVILAGETHLYRKPGAMRFTEDAPRRRFANMVVHSIKFPPKVLALADVLAARMRERTGGRQWMGAHMRRGDFVRTGWAMESTPEAHVQRVKDRLATGREAIAHLTVLATYDFEGAEPDMEQITVPPPLPGDAFYVATDERDPDARQAISDAGAVMMSDLLTMEDRRAFGWPLMVTDVLALVEQALLIRSAFFYGHGMSSLAGVITNLRAARGADPRTMLLD